MIVIAGVVHSNRARRCQLGELPLEEPIVVIVNGEVVETAFLTELVLSGIPGTGPLATVSWLAERLECDGNGEELDVGQMILTATPGSLIPLTAGSMVDVRFAGLTSKCSVALTVALPELPFSVLHILLRDLPRQSVRLVCRALNLVTKGVDHVNTAAPILLEASRPTVSEQTWSLCEERAHTDWRQMNALSGAGRGRIPALPVVATYTTLSDALGKHIKAQLTRNPFVLQNRIRVADFSRAQEPDLDLWCADSFWIQILFEHCSSDCECMIYLLTDHAYTDAYSHFQILNWVINAPATIPKWGWCTGDDSCSVFEEWCGVPYFHIAPSEENVSLGLHHCYDVASTKAQLPPGITLNDKITFDLAQRFCGCYNSIIVLVNLREPGCELMGMLVGAIEVPTAVATLDEVHFHIHENQTPVRVDPTRNSVILLTNWRHHFKPEHEVSDHGPVAIGAGAVNLSNPSVIVHEVGGKIWVNG